jgi:hypothetical protein
MKSSLAPLLKGAREFLKLIGGNFICKSIWNVVLPVGSVRKPVP